MDTRDIRCFRLVYEASSINKAAGQLFITPQGLSCIIRNLESELQVELFVRAANGTTPTDAGFLIGAASHADLASRTVYQGKMNAVIYSGHPYYDRETLSVRDLQDQPLISMNQKYASYHNLI